MNIGQAIAQDRQRLGLTQGEFARRIGVSQQSVSKWEEGISAPRGKRLERIVQAVGEASLTANAMKTMSNDHQRMLPPSPETIAALTILAKAAADIAQAAQKIADSVVKIAGPQHKPGRRPH